jgi:hypothetical protein
MLPRDDMKTMFTMVDGVPVLNELAETSYWIGIDNFFRNLLHVACFFWIPGNAYSTFPSLRVSVAECMRNVSKECAQHLKGAPFAHTQPQSHTYASPPALPHLHVHAVACARWVQVGGGWVAHMLAIHPQLFMTSNCPPISSLSITVHILQPSPHVRV